MLSAFALSVLCVSLRFTAASDSCQDQGSCESGAVGGTALLQNKQQRSTLTELTEKEHSEQTPACFVASIALQTKTWASEISWDIVQSQSPDTTPVCTGTGYTNNQLFPLPCCLAAGVSYTLVCKDSYGDTWHGGYMIIDGTRYCSEGGNWREKRVDFTLGSSPPPAPAPAPTVVPAPAPTPVPA
eukprot:CAMPEP_0168443724 /NCGR_PEP_ID=MMETSP0228-20121227/44678_1 /TAXON_ID=133427 /ORGANISM="Protoceratium reticulatum, Strain CCCM 535 (=CCMP 1889)" /LENGTH=184 /DNA_ID=CAMNT_0008458139 /DNA_START=132 /DNA_END=683 /DNA_ORIENTATION=+